MKKITAIGLMSGTSLDGLDICAVNFLHDNNSWQFEIINSETIKYSVALKEKFKLTTSMSALNLLKFDVQLGELMGGLTRQFIKSNRLSVDFIASHGHTVYHQPENGFTLQIGNGQQIALETKLPVVCDFRSKDVALGGQGAPLVPIGDQLLFSEYDACINFGGIANVSFDNEVGERVAFDICPFNMGLNFLANKLELEYDDGGSISKSGCLNVDLLNTLNQLDYYKLEAPKSLGVEWFLAKCLPLLDNSEFSVKDRMCTFSHHIADQVSITINNIEGHNVLITGGGVYNSFIIDLIKDKTAKKIIKPSNSIIDFKEALIFAFLGVLKMQGEVNVLKSVTGATMDSSSGVLFLP